MRYNTSTPQRATDNSATADLTAALYTSKVNTMLRQFKREENRVIYDKDTEERDLYFVGQDSNGRKVVLTYETKKGKMCTVHVRLEHLRRPPK